MAIDPSLICFFRGEYVPLAEAKIGILTHGFSYGTGCFEGIRGYYNDDHQQLYLFRLSEHFVRLQQSAHILMIDLPYGVEELGEITRECLRRSDLHEDVYVRPSAYKSSEIIGVRLHNLDDDLYIAVQPFGNYIDIDRPLRAGISSWRRVDDNAVPARAKITGSYINSALAKSEALLNGFDEAIVLTAEGHVSEGSAENIFMLRRGQLITPPVSENLLEGVTRETVMTLVQDELGVPVIERPIDRTELYVADEIFLCGTGAQIAPVGSIDHRAIGSGEVGDLTRQVQKLYFDVVRGNVPKYAAWCTPVYDSPPAAVEVPRAPVAAVRAPGSAEQPNGHTNGHADVLPSLRMTDTTLTRK